MNSAVDGIKFDSRSHVEAGLLKAEAHSTGTCEQVNPYRSH
jgi:hypothetical protein